MGPNRELWIYTEIDVEPKLPLSYTSISKFNSCPLSYYYKISGVKKSFAPEVFVKGRERHTLLHKYGMYIKSGYTSSSAKDHAKASVSPKFSSIIREFDRVNTRLEYNDNVFLERKLSVNRKCTGEGGFFTGILDYIKIDEDSNKALIVDYKGAIMLPSYSLQAKLYAALAAAIYGVSEITVRMFLVSRNQYADDVINVSGEEAIEFMVSYLEDAVKRIKAVSGKDLHPVVGNECSVCQYKHECPAMKSAIDSVRTGKSLAEMSKDELIALKALYASEMEKIKALIGFPLKERSKKDKTVENAKDILEFFDKFDIDAIKEGVIVVDEKTLWRTLKDYKLGVAYVKKKNNNE